MLVPGKPFQPCLMCVGKAWSLPYSVAPEKCLIRVGTGFTPKTLDLAGQARDEHSSLLRTFVNYGRKKFKTWDPVAVL